MKNRQNNFLSAAGQVLKVAGVGLAASVLLGLPVSCGTTEKIVYVEGGPGTEGGTGSEGDSGSGGGLDDWLPSSVVGKACEDSYECAVGLICLMGAEGPAHGYCTRECEPETSGDCQDVDELAVCLSASDGNNYCHDTTNQ